MIRLKHTEKSLHSFNCYYEEQLIIIVCCFSILLFQLVIMASEILCSKTTTNYQAKSFLCEICQLRSGVKELTLIRVQVSVKSSGKNYNYALFQLTW